MNAKCKNLRHTLSDGVLSVRIEGEIDHHSSAFIRSGLDELMTDCAPGKLILDLSGVSFMDSSGLGLVLGRFSKADAAGIAFEVINADRHIMRIFDMAGMTRMINIQGANK